MTACRYVCKMMGISLNGFKQGFVMMASTLFSMMFSVMPMDAFQDSDTGFPIRYRFDGTMFNLRRLQAKTKVQTDRLDELVYADVMDKSASSEAKMQRFMDQVSQSCDNYDLRIRTKKKTKIVHQPAPEKPYNEPAITVNGHKLKVPTWEALSPEQCTLMMRLLPELRDSEDSVQMSGSVLESNLTQS